MKNELPEKITRIDVIKIERGRRKLCNCLEPHYEIDTQNKIVMCINCGAVLDPFDTLVKIATRCERLNNQVEVLLNEAKAIQNYKPHLKIFKEIEHRYRANKFSLLPCCPNCGEVFDFSDLTSWASRAFYNKEREKNG